jgi:serine/threonine-protein kinase
MPFFSPDGRWLGYFAHGQLLKIAIAGGSPVTLAPAPDPFGATWVRDGNIVFAASANGGLSIVPATGGPPRSLTTPGAGEGGHHWPDALSDGSAIVFTVAADAAHRDRQYAGVLSLRTGAWSRLIDGVSVARVSIPGYLVAQRGRDLVGVAFDSRALAINGVPAVAAPGSASAEGLLQFAASAAGTLVTGSASASALQIVLDWDTELHRLVPSPQPALPR